MRRPDGEAWTLETFTAGAETTGVWNIVAYSDLFGTRRLDSEFYQPKYVDNEASVLRYPSTTRLASIVTKFAKGIFDIKAEEYVSDGVPFVRINNLRNGVISEKDIAYITPERHNEERKTALKKYDLVLSKTAYPAASLIQLDICNTSQDIIAVQTKYPKEFNIYLATYLNTPFGLLQMERLFQGNIQKHLSLPEARTIIVAIPNERIQSEIAQLFEESIREREASETLYNEAQALLLHELGLDRLDLSPDLTYEGTFGGMWSSGRMDAEYFAPKYERLLEHIKNTGQAVRLGDWITGPIRRGTQPIYDAEGDFIVINSQHVGKTHIELGDNERTTRKFAQANARAIVKPDDVLLNSTGYITIGRCQAFLDDVLAVVDVHVSIIRPKSGLDPVYLALFLNTLAGQMQTERGWTGSSGQIELRPDTIADYVIWRPAPEFQQKIRRMVEDAHKARQEAESLLEEAKRRVEQMILGEG